jgi:hypothetical protein
LSTRAEEIAATAEVVEGQPQDRGTHRHCGAATARVDRQERARVDGAELREVVSLQRLQPHKLT